jgi:hypothetical protein
MEEVAGSKYAEWISWLGREIRKERYERAALRMERGL